MKERYLNRELLGGKDKRQYWVCVNSYVRNRLEGEERKGPRKSLALFLTHGVGFGKEVRAAGFLIPSTSIDFFVVLGTGIVASTVEPQWGRRNYRRGVVMGRRQSRRLSFTQQGESQLTLYLFSFPPFVSVFSC